MIKRWRIVFYILSCLGISIALYGILYILSQRVVINNVSYKDIEYAKVGVLDSVEPMFVQDELNEFVTYTANFSYIENRNFLRCLSDYFTGKKFTIDVNRDVNTNALISYLEQYNKSGVDSKDAYIERGEEGFYIIDDIVSDKIDIHELVANLDSDKIDLNDFRVKADIKTSDLVETCEVLNNLANWNIIYDKGVSVTVPKDSVTYNKSLGILLNDSFISDSMDFIQDSYNTVGKQRDFITSSGEKIKISDGTWGSIVDEEAEINFLRDKFNTGTSLKNRTPIYKYEREEIGDSYIEISKSDQHLWLYIDGELVMETDVVTGNKSNHDTPSGIYFISERKSGKYLTGDTYKTWVDKWMRITNRGHGLHDAGWRSKFGGRIYEYNGSHGCINLPKRFAYSLYDKTYYGMPVVIY